MFQVEGTQGRSIQGPVAEACRYYKIVRLVHAGFATFFIATGIVALLLSLGSNGNAQVPYYFSAFISGVWHLIFAGLCLVCIYYLSGDGHRNKNAAKWVKAYCVMCCVFVLFNVMGVVFTVVNGVCIKDQMCYYDKNEVANRFMAILLILQHCITIVTCVFLTKKGHLIDTELSSDITIRLYHHFDFSKIAARLKARAAKHKSNAKSVRDAEANVGSSGSIPSISTTKSSTKDEDEVFAGPQTSAAEKFEKIRNHHKKKSKSQPNLHQRNNSDGATEIKGTLVSIYSGSDMVKNEQKMLKSKFKLVIKSNKVWPGESVSQQDLQSYISGETSSSDDEAPPLVFQRSRSSKDSQNNPLQNNATDEECINSGTNIQQEILRKQEEVLREQQLTQKQQREVLDQQTSILYQELPPIAGSMPQPPPYVEQINYNPIPDVTS